MSKNNSNGNGAGQSGPPTVHLILQGKSGVGKSVVASWLAEFLINRGQLVRCIDGDPVNRSFGQYKAFSAEKLYDLRSTYATRLSAGGVPDEWVTQLLRQGDANLFKKYSQMKLQMKREALAKLNRLANEGGPGFGTVLAQ